MKKMLATLALVGAMTITAHGADVGFYDRIAEDLDIIQVYDTNDLNYDILSGRSKNGIIIIEKIIGVVLNSKGDGKILNTDDEQYDYISYRCVDGVKSGDTIITYFIYNPENNAEDDIIERFDYIVDTEK